MFGYPFADSFVASVGRKAHQETAYSMVSSTPETCNSAVRCLVLTVVAGDSLEMASVHSARVKFIIRR